MQHGYVEAGMDGLKEYFGGADEIVDLARDAAIVITQLAPLSAGIIERLPNLRLIAVSRGGPVNIDLAAARERKILVVNTPGRNASAVAEFTLGAILAETRLIIRGHEALRRGEWRGDLYRADRTGWNCREMTVGIVGYGHVGTKVVRILKAFGCRILVCDPYVQLSADDLNDGVEQVSLERIIADSDVVTLHARVTEETRGFLRSRAVRRDETRRLFREHGARTARRLRRLDGGAAKSALARRGDRHVRHRTGAGGLGVAATRQCDAHAAHRGRLDEDGQVRRAGLGRGGAPISPRRAAVESLRMEVGAPRQ